MVAPRALAWDPRIGTAAWHAGRVNEMTPADADRNLVRGWLAPEQLPDIAAVWISGSEWDSPALRELAGHPRHDLDGIRALWARVRAELGVPPRGAPADDRLTRSQFLEAIDDLGVAVEATDVLDGATTDVLLQLWSALNGPGGPQIEGLHPDEEALIVRAYAQYCDVTEPLLDHGQQRGAGAEAVLTLRRLVHVVAAQTQTQTQTP